MIRSSRFAAATFLFVFLFFGSSQIFAQTNAKVPTPRSVLGFNPGDDRTIADWKQITNYFSLLDKASNRVEVKTLGTTTLNRPFIAAFISSEENIRDLEKYKAMQGKIADPRKIISVEERDRLLKEGKTVVAISCSIHSTEIVASQMSMQFAYSLASATDEDTKEILRNTILILIPSANPDGIDIVADWYRKTLNTPYEGTNPPELYHHYAGHDNNRDWFMLNLKETRLVTQLFWKEWFPEIVYDVHQMGSTGPRFCIPPFYDPSNPNIPPTILREVGLIGYTMAAELQAQNYKGVITNAIFDTWWHGGFRSTPYYHNSIGILSEAASAKLMTPIRIKEEELLAQRPQRGVPPNLAATTNYPEPWRGGIWGARDIMQMEMIACRTVLTLAARYREKYVKNFYELNRIASGKLTNPSHPYAYLIPPGQGNEESLSRMIEILMAQGVEVHKMNRELHVYITSGEKGWYEMPAGGYMILMSQPARNHIQALFEKQVYPDRVGASGLAEQPYDVAGWTLPMMMGIQTQEVSEIKEFSDDVRRLSLIKDINEVRRDLALDEKRSDMSPIKNPIKENVRVGLYKSWMSSMDEGWTRLIFETFKVPYQSMLDAEVKRGDLRSRFDVIVLPSQSDKQIAEGNAKGSYPDEYTGGITETGVENLRQFVEAGGTLITFDDSTEFAIKRFKLPVKNVLEGLKSSDFYCPGSVLSIDVDSNHPLGKWMKPKTDAYFTNSAAFDVEDTKSVTVIARYAEKDVLRSGWLRGEKFLTGKVALAEAQLGKGRVILFGFRPQHRGQTWGTFQFIFNAIMRG